MSDSNDPENSFETTESAQLILKNVTILSELSSQLMKETKNGESCLNSLNNLLFQAGKDISSVHQCVDSLLVIAKKLVHLSLQIVPIKDPNFKSLKTEADKLLSVLDEIKDSEECRAEDKCRQAEKVCKGSTRCLTDDRYPDHCSRESLLDISTVVGLPTVPEDAFASFQRPSRTLSSCSLKNVRKVKLCLQKACGIEAEEEFYGSTSNAGTRKKDFDSINVNTQTVDWPITMSTGTDPHPPTDYNEEERSK